MSNRRKPTSTRARRLLVAIVVQCSLLGSAAPVFAWDDYGHMLVAAIAYEKLEPSARTRVAELLKLHPQYETWVKNVDAKDRERVAFVTAATWADAIKRDPDYQNDGEEPHGAAAGQNLGYADKLMHRYWHYIDLPFSADGTALKEPAAPNAKTQIAAFRAALNAKASSDALKSYDLVWLLHLVGDVHQPLHCTSRFDKTQPDGDRGGNLVALCVAPCTEQLHLLWDLILGVETAPAAAIQKATKLKPASAKPAAISDEAAWIEESFQIARDSIYTDPPIGVGAGPFTIDAKYRARARRLATSRVALAGARLASLLNDAFAVAHPP
jgi:hypothetical protein